MLYIYIYIYIYICNHIRRPLQASCVSDLSAKPLTLSIVPLINCPTESIEIYKHMHTYKHICRTCHTSAPPICRTCHTSPRQSAARVTPQPRQSAARVTPPP